MPVSLFGNKVIGARTPWIGLFCVAAGALGAALLLIGFLDVFSANRLSVTAGTNVTHVSVVVTHGTNHTFYYRGKARWMWNEACKRFGWRMLADGERRHSSTYEPADMLWVACKHRGEPLDPRLFQALEVTVQGRRRIYKTTGGICDRKRGVSVSNWALLGGIEGHRGSVISIRYGTRELTRVDLW